MTSVASPPAVEVAAHVGWAGMIGRQIAAPYRFRPKGQEEADICQVACLTVVRAAGRFDPAFCPAGGDPAGLFRGWVRRDVVQECQINSRMLLNDGTYRTRREYEQPRLTKAYSLSDLASRTADGCYDLPADYRHDVLALPDPDRPRPLYDLTYDDMPPARSRSARYAPRPREACHAS